MICRNGAIKEFSGCLQLFLPTNYSSCSLQAPAVKPRIGKMGVLTQEGWRRRCNTAFLMARSLPCRLQEVQPKEVFISSVDHSWCKPGLVYGGPKKEAV
ncbi:hypothetical protein PFLUV_G00164040 [Perca fluviatilis]|uniref:Uncharacterized protein n=1 Tax=Perca fluviatilis TaxID=8168 RepID=A0A6A5DXQ8_PERFL|nr:hypothetical protein PFLUV_G00164040 [Perca fluviatilis]